jgi:hypothetical protein
LRNPAIDPMEPPIGRTLRCKPSTSALKLVPSEIEQDTPAA